MAAKQNGKRSAPTSLGPSKKRKLSSKSGTQSGPKKYPVKPKEKKKEKLADRGTIPIPVTEDADDFELSDQDLEVLREYGGATSFLSSLDTKGISRSKKETDRLHQLNKPARKVVEDDLPSIDSNDEDDEGGSFGSSDVESLAFDDESISSDHEDASEDSDIEMDYEKTLRKRRPSWEPEDNRGIKGLPIKLPDGNVHSTGKVSFAANPNAEESSDSEGEESEVEAPPPKIDDVSTGARFGRPAVVDVVSNKSQVERLRAAKEQIAGICQEIVSDPENSLGLLRRLHTFSLSEITSPSHPDPVPNDPIVRKLAMLSQLAVFKDIIPGYRIRSLTDKEKSEKVSQIVARTRDWEQGLVTVYQTYLRSLETELKARSDLAEVALKSMCTLLKDVTHFNFRVNLMGCIVARLSRKSWDSSSDLCLNTLIHVFREDLTGAASLELVRLLNRMIKEKRFSVHPEVLSCLLHLRLKTELGVRASETSVDKPQKESSSKSAARRAKGKSTDLPHLSKKAKKALKEKREIDKEFREAEAEVDKEDRAITQTETLKLLFVLYFRIIKNTRPTPLLPAALHGISRFAHLVNIDFFKDLMAVLKELILQDSHQDEDDVIDPSITTANDIRHRLQCITTAFELLSGQGTIMADIDATPPSLASGTRPAKTHAVSDMLFRTLNIVFSPRSSGASVAPGRSAAFAKRLLSAALHWPPTTALRALEFVGALIAKNPKLEALLSTKDRTFDGIYRPDLDDPQLSNPFGSSFWELHILREKHWDARVRAEANRILNTVHT
ncbi:hypothetical protein H0H92_002654 [Tricholoma furcatifolium]|nr:hypothetical protein H0H92_002654 [Tricholoma furcatifolium]